MGTKKSLIIPLISLIFIFGLFGVVSAVTFDAIISTADPTIVDTSFTPKIGSELIRNTEEAFIGRTTTYTGLVFGANPDVIKWEVTVVGPSALTADMIEFDEVGFLDDPDTSPSIGTFHYPFSQGSSSNELVALGSCTNANDHDNGCTTDAFSLDEDDVFHNADKIKFNSNAPLGTYTITYQLVNTDDPDSVSIDNHQVTFTLTEDILPVITNVFIEPEFPNLNSILVKVFASITDESGIDFADLFWRVKGDDTIHSATFTGPFSGGFAGIVIGDPKDGVIIEYHIKAVDNSGNTAWDPSIRTFHRFTYDGSAPTTTDDASTGWTNQEVLVTLNCGDTISGCKETFFSTDGSEPSLLYSSPFILSDTGEHQLTYFSTDNAGNQENVVTGNLVQIDKEAPTITDDYTNDGVFWVNLSQIVTLNPQDTGGSGISSVKTCKGVSCVPSTLLTSPYKLTFDVSQDTIVRYQVFDVAGNPSVIGEFNVKIDLVTPITTDDIPADWQNTAFDVTLSVAVDSLSPTTTNHKFWRVNEIEPLNFSQGNLINVNVDGEYNLEYFSEDDAGNIEVVKTASNLAKLDTLSPQVFINGNLPSDWRNGSVTLGVQCNDELSQCDPNSFAVIEVPEGTVDCSTVDYSGGANSFVANSHVHLCAKASDNAGNTGFSEVTEVLIENEAPSVTITSNSSTDEMDYFIVKADVSDTGGSELESVELTLKQDGSVIQGLENVPMTLVLNEDYEYLLRMWELVEGEYTLEVTATDNAGNSFTHDQGFTILPNVAPSRITSTNNQVNATTGGTVSFDFDVVVRNDGKIRFSIDDVAGLSPNSLNAKISNGIVNVSVGSGIEFIGAGILDLEDSNTGIPNVQGSFTLYLDIPEEVIPGNYPINYFIDVV